MDWEGGRWDFGALWFGGGCIGGLGEEAGIACILVSILAASATHAASAAAAARFVVAILAQVMISQIHDRGCEGASVN